MNEEEKIVIGLILQKPERYHEAIELGLTPQCFMNDIASMAFDKMQLLVHQGLEINFATLGLQMREQINFIADAFENTIDVRDFSFFVKSVKHANWFREFGSKISNLVAVYTRNKINPDVQSLITEASNLSHWAQSAEDSSSVIPLNRSILTYTELLEARVCEGIGSHQGIDCGLKSATNALGGWRGGKLYLIAARTSVGKTTFATFLALQAIKQDKSVLFFTNEMSDLELTEKLIAADSGVPTNNLFRGDLSEKQRDDVVRSMGAIGFKNLYFDLRSGRQLETFTSRIREFRRKGKCDLVFLDYIQQMNVESRRFYSDHKELGFISNAIKQLSRDLDIPIIALVQVNRDVERGGKSIMPGLANLKDCGSFEQDADAVIIIHKEMFLPKFGPEKEKTILNFAKNRFGKTGHIRIHAELETSRFRDCTVEELNEEQKIR